jgi:serpin B
MPTTKTMLGIGACAIAVVALCRRALRTPTPRDGRPQLTRQNAYRTLPGLRDDPPSYEAATAPKEHIGGGPPRAEGDYGATPAFALELLKALSSDRENVFVSPLSIATALKMALAGATPGSRHEAALRKAVGGIDVSVAGIDAANALYARAGVKASFADKLKRLFNAAAEPMPASAAPINKFVATATKGLITDLVDDGTVRDPMTTAILLNAVYFKGTWQAQFVKGNSRPGAFHTPAGEKQVDFMRQERRYAVRAAAGVGQSVALPYAKDDLRMVLILPEDEGLAGARATAAALPARWAELRPLDEEKVVVVLPRFKIDSGIVELMDVLDASFDLGLIKREGGGFLEIADRPDLHVDSVLHRAVISVDEEGTEAAAATAVIVAQRAMPRPARVLKFDRPFVFAIEHAATGRVVFAGAPYR